MYLFTYKALTGDVLVISGDLVVYYEQIKYISIYD